MTHRLKRRAAPRSWPIARKGTKWTMRPDPGPHSQRESLPVTLVLRDVLKLARSAREVMILIREGKISIDGKVVKDPARGIGLMDVLSIGSPPTKHYRMLKNSLGKMELHPIEGDESGWKLARIRFKHTVPGGKVALTLHDGRNILVDAKSEYKVGDSLKVALPSQKILGKVPLSPGMLAYLSGGSHVGEVAHVDRVDVVPSSEPNKVRFKEGFSTIKDYAFIVGESTPLISLIGGVVK